MDSGGGLTHVDATGAAIGEIDASIRHVADGVDTLSQLAADNTTSILEMAASIEEVAQNAEALTQAVEAVSPSLEDPNLFKISAGSWLQKVPDPFIKHFTLHEFYDK